MSGKRGGSRPNAGRKPILCGKRHHIYLDDDSYFLLKKYTEITHANKPNYKLSETLREILQEHDRKHSKKITAANKQNVFTIIDELLNSENSNEYLHHELRVHVNRAYTAMQSRGTAIDAALNVLMKNKAVHIHAAALSNYFSQNGIELSNTEMIVRYLLQYCEREKAPLPQPVSQSYL